MDVCLIATFLLYVTDLWTRLFVKNDRKIKNNVRKK